MKVHILSPEVISKIAAGEVIDRPASAVKELLENALDAQSSSIEINLKQAGKAAIHIKDTGAGIDHDDIEKIFERHATSKIKSIDDLSYINSLGFRGEALYSIAAISDITLRSKTSGQDTGWHIHMRGGKKLDLKPINMSVGTEIEIKELFFNTPARRKFMKSDVTELHRILNTCVPYTLAHYKCAFSIKHFNKPLIDTPPHPDIITRISSALNLRIEHLLYKELLLPEKQISMSLVLGDINIQRPKKDLQFIFINDRPVQSRSLSFHLNHVYRAIMPQDSNPFFCVFVTMPSNDIDVNIHPTKREVKLKNEQYIASLLRGACEETLLYKGSPKQVGFTPSLGSASSIKPSLYKNESFPRTNTVKEKSPTQYFLYQENSSAHLQQNSLASQKDQSLKNKLAVARYIGPFIKKYLLFETPFSLLIIDQHAAQERVTYEILIRQIKKGTLEIQNLLTPIILTLSPQEKLIWKSVRKKLEELGFSTTQWDGSTIAVHSSPQLIKNPKNAVLNILSAEKPVAEFDNETLARYACRNSLMAGYEMIAQQAEYLRDRLLSCHDPFACPHGRPTVIELNEQTLDKEFFRK